MQEENPNAQAESLPERELRCATAWNYGTLGTHTDPSDIMSLTVAENGTPLQALLSLQLFKLQRYLKFCGPQVAHFEKVSSFNLPRPCPKADLLRFPRRKRSIETAENQWLDGCATTISTKT